MRPLISLLIIILSQPISAHEFATSKACVAAWPSLTNDYEWDHMTIAQASELVSIEPRSRLDEIGEDALLEACERSPGQTGQAERSAQDETRR